MRISQDTAGSIAMALTKKSYDKYVKSKSFVKQFVTALYVLKMPQIVTDCFNSHSQYFSTTETIYIEGIGFGYNSSVEAVRGLPRNNGGGNNCRLRLNDSEAEELRALISSRDNHKKEYEDLKQQTKNSLIALGTYKKIIEHFPEAAAFLPTTAAKTMALIPDLNKLTEKLKNQ